MRKNSFFILLIFSIFSVPTVCVAAETGTPEEPPVKRTAEKKIGQVVSISPTSIAVLYETKGNNEYEVLIPFEKDVTLEGYKKNSEIAPGDTIELGYEKVVKSEGTPDERSTMTMKKIRFIKRPVKNTLVAEEKEV